MAALEARYDSDTDESADDTTRRESVAALARRALMVVRGGVAVAASESTKPTAHSSKPAGRWSHFAPASGRQRLRLDSEDDAEVGSAAAPNASASTANAAAAAVTSTDEELEPWSLDTEMFPPAPSSVYADLTDAEIREAMLRGAVLRAPQTRLPARDSAWRPSAGAPSSVILTVSRHRHVAIYDTRARRQAVVHKEAVGDWALTCCAVDPLSHCAYVGDSVGNVSRLELRRGLRTVQRYHGNAGTITSIQLHDTLPLVATTGLDRCMRVFHAETGEMVRRVYLKQRLTACLFGRERRVKRPDYRREYAAQTDKLGLVVRVSCLKGGWRDGVEGKRFRSRPREGETEEPVEDDGVTEAELEAAGVGAGADQAGGRRTRPAGGAEDEDDDEDEDAVWGRLEQATDDHVQGPENDEQGDDDESGEDEESDGSDFDEELEADEYAAAAASAQAAGKQGRDDSEDETGAGTAAGDDGDHVGARPKRTKAGAAASGYDSLGEDSIGDEDGDEEEDDDKESSDSDPDDEDGAGRMRRLKHGDEDLELVDDPKALKNARKEAVRGRKNEERQVRARQLQQRRAERGGGSTEAAGGRARGGKRGGRGRRR